MQSNEYEKRKLIVHKYVENPSRSGSSIAKELKLSKSTVNKVINRYKQSLSVDRKPGSGGKPGSRDKKLDLKVMKSLTNNPGLSIRDQGKKFGTSASNIVNIRLRNGHRSYRAIKKPNRTDKQELEAKKRARKLYDDVLTKFDGCILMDDETYVKMDSKQLPGQKFYSATARCNVPKQFKYVLQDKFPRKGMIWQAICSCGIKSRTFITSGTMNSQMYIDECLQKRVLPLIRKHKVPVKFWPDLASIHYSRLTMKWFEDNEVDVIPKIQNPPNCPKLRPIEEFWAIVKKKLKKIGGSSTDIVQLRSKWDRQSANVSRATVQKLMGTITTRTREFIRASE